MKTLSRFFTRLNHWLSNHQPVQCHICFGWMLNKNAIYERTTAGAQVRLCSTCHQNLFHPFTKKADKK